MTEQGEFDFDLHDELWGFYHAHKDMLEDGEITIEEFLHELEYLFKSVESKYGKANE